MTEFSALPDPDPATPRQDNPADWLELHYRQRWLTQGSTLGQINPALSVEAFGFARHQGDWLGVVVTPWFLRLFLINGGGTLWGDIPPGQRRYVELPYGTLPFVAEYDPQIGALQYSALVASIGEVPDMATARLIAADILQAFLPPSVVEAPVVAPSTNPVAEEAPQLSRRGFFRRLAGKR